MNLTQWLSVAGIAIDILCTTLLIVLIYKRAKVEAVKADAVQAGDFETLDIVRPGKAPETITIYKDRPPCPKCKSRNAYKNGWLKGSQRYHCRACRSVYVAQGA